MVPVFLAQWMKEKRSPYMVLIFISISIAAALLFGSNMDIKLKIDTFRGEGVTVEEAERWIDRLNESGAFIFSLRAEEESLADVRQGRSDMAVRLLKDDYRIIAVMESTNVELVQQHMQAVYHEEFRIMAAASHAEDELEFREAMKTYMEQPPLKLQSSTSSGSELRSYDMRLQLLFGFSLFLAMLTVGFRVNAMTAEKISGIWNRVILSPLTKTEMYLGHLTYSTLIGIVQITMVFLLAKYLFGFSLGHSFGMLAMIVVLYTMTIVAMSMLFTGILRTPEQFGAIFTSIVPIMPLISGAYMPPGTITNDVLLFIGQFLPLQHALDALIGVSIYEQGWTDIYLPLAKLLLMTVIFFGVGINLVERRRL
ncbi:ABC transporter permease [Paenibacillus sp. FSL W7-1287]|uniref:ABC transporter permease n=1 Tax=Paenibacillus sp. FSL W7-1287 TaxID=2954538 RepID=UPI0030F5703D